MHIFCPACFSAKGGLRPWVWGSGFPSVAATRKVTDGDPQSQATFLQLVGSAEPRGDIGEQRQPGLLPPPFPRVLGVGATEPVLPPSW